MSPVTELDQKVKDQTAHLEKVDQLSTKSSDNSIFDTDNLDELDSIENTPSSKFVWLVSITASVGGLLFGYDTGIISAVLVYLDDDLGKILNSSDKELITSITSGGAFIGAVVAGLTADRYGRKGAIYVGAVLFIIGAILQACSYSLVQMTF
ncbi:hypothetical protein B7463_g12548, partial [Scytalidium lignicola]